MTKNDFPSVQTQRETGTGAQLLWKINGPARCRDSEKGDHPMLLLITEEKDKAAVIGPWDRHSRGVDSSLHAEYKIT